MSAHCRCLHMRTCSTCHQGAVDGVALTTTSCRPGNSAAGRGTHAHDPARGPPPARHALEARWPNCACVQMIADGQHADLLDRIYSAYDAYKHSHDLVLMEGPGPLMGETELDAQAGTGSWGGGVLAVCG
jgi:hypothetical protein